MAWARTFMTDLALEPELAGEICLYDIDTEAAKRNEIIGNRITKSAEALGKWQYVTTPALQEALTGADFVVLSILPGTFEHMRSDVHLPERLGVYQSVGDTTGPGGVIRALRTIPLYVNFAEAIKKYAPEAWIINYTNPMALCVRTLYHTFPEIKAFGCCHEVFGAQTLLAAMVERERKIEVTRQEIKVNVMGINHFTWFDSALYEDADIMPLFGRCADEFYESGFSTKYDLKHEPVFRCTNRVKFDLYQNYELIAAAGDRHLAEFMPGDLYLKDARTAENWGFVLTSVDWRIGDRERKRERTERLVSGEEQLPLVPSGEEGMAIIKALCGHGDIVTNVNLPNSAGQICNLPKDTVVETNASFSHNSVVPIEAGSLPINIFDLVAVHAENQAEVISAAINCDRDAVLRVFERDPLLRGRCSQADLSKLVDDMIENTIDVLPQGWK